MVEKVEAAEQAEPKPAEPAKKKGKAAGAGKGAVTETAIVVAKNPKNPKKPPAEKKPRSTHKKQGRPAKWYRLKLARIKAGLAPEDRRAKKRGEHGDVHDTRKEKRGVIYLGGIPDGFEEYEMKRYFKQFGEVTRWRLARSKKNAKPKGWGWVEFEEKEVAKIVADTMNGYLLFEKKLKSHVVEHDDLHPEHWKNWDRKRVNLTGVRRRAHLAIYNNRPAVDVEGERVALFTRSQVIRMEKKNSKLKNKLKEMGVEFDLSEFKPPKMEESMRRERTRKLKVRPEEGVPTLESRTASAEEKKTEAAADMTDEEVPKEDATAAKASKAEEAAPTPVEEPASKKKRRKSSVSGPPAAEPPPAEEAVEEAFQASPEASKKKKRKSSGSAK